MPALTNQARLAQASQILLALVSQHQEINQLALSNQPQEISRQALAISQPVQTSLVPHQSKVERAKIRCLLMANPLRYKSRSRMTPQLPPSLVPSQARSKAPNRILIRMTRSRTPSRIRSLNRSRTRSRTLGQTRSGTISQTVNRLLPSPHPLKTRKTLPKTKGKQQRIQKMMDLPLNLLGRMILLNLVSLLLLRVSLDLLLKISQGLLKASQGLL